jgi:phosphopantetheine adenylyltransferase
MYGKKCPMCRQTITKSSYIKIKKVKHEPEIVDYSTGLTNEEFNRVMFLRALQNTSDLELELLNKNINRQFQEIVINCPRGQYLDVSNSYIKFTLTPK